MDEKSRYTSVLEIPSQLPFFVGDDSCEGARAAYGERVETAFVESTINTVVGKRFSKRQQMRWSKPGAHLMFQTRTRVLDDTLRVKFQSWYPGLFNVQNANDTEHDLAA